ncbi:DEAD/DEAH box helicase [Halobacillus yeomjeoni]|uniref:DNA2/NAM7 helicase-like C-terminal domain-containing protein n=1 Tax=Halobacillus yeomjeoni TaxID=311194 RepID=A0A931MWS1_9BACI|nr:AAA domain-containing protein [Halobacillus yeomjeoni]MBH0231511.1 hypothetical protein [Halobacillus yeomjeoni]
MNYTSYFRTSLIDAERYGTRYQDISHGAVQLSIEDIRCGILPSGVVQRLFDGREEKELEVLINPLLLCNDAEVYIAPLWIPAILHSSGYLSPHERDIPWMTTYYLAPSRTGDPSIGYVEDYEEFYQGRKLTFPTWDDYWTFASSLFKCVSGQSLETFQHEDFETVEHSSISIRKEGLGNKGDLISVLDDMSRKGEGELPEIYRRMITYQDDSPISLPSDDLFLASHPRHLGHFPGNDALSTSQRQALYYIFEENEGGVLAINGPPGTGKSMMMNCIASSLYVESALLKQKHPQVLTATAHDRFTSLDIAQDFECADSSLIEKRWIHSLDHYALYLGNEEGEDSSLKGVNFLNHFKETISNPDIRAKSREEFLQNTNAYFIHQCSTLNEAVEVIHNELCHTVSEIKEAVDILQQGNEEEVLRWLSSHNFDYINEKVRSVMAKTIDLKLRKRAFCLSVKYWEARWIMDQDEEDILSFVPSLMKLFPILVVPAFDLPKFFTKENKEPSYESIDLLMIDESGQMLPEMAAGIVPFAKKIVAVGDIHQATPIRNITRTFDLANLLNQGWNKELTEDMDLLASGGSALRVFQRLSSFQVHPDVKGMFLTEHRRSVPEVINFCDELVYQDWLIPVRESYQNYPFHHMGFIDVDGEVTKHHTGLSNTDEAQHIVEWILENQQELQSFYGEEDLSVLVAIVTPFTEQMHEIKKILKKKGLKNITVGTIHMMQGSSSPVVLFSSVYRRGSFEELNFDEDKTLLNVAVSRAKDSFIVFGESDLFNEEGDKPSNVLKRHTTD